jgi:hypothetical protein
MIAKATMVPFSQVISVRYDFHLARLIVIASREVLSIP